MDILALKNRRAALAAEIDDIDEQIARAVGVRPLADRIVEALRRLNALHRFDGLVPLPYLRRELADVERAHLDAALLRLELDQRLALKISNDPAAASEPEHGIHLDGRGLIYFARVRG